METTAQTMSPLWRQMTWWVLLFRIWFELHKPEPDRERVVRLNRYNIWLAGGQGVMQLAMILIMAHFRF